MHKKDFNCCESEVLSDELSVRKRERRMFLKTSAASFAMGVGEGEGKKSRCTEE